MPSSTAAEADQLVCTPASVNFASTGRTRPLSCSLSITFFFSGGMTSFAFSRAAPRRSVSPTAPQAAADLQFDRFHVHVDFDPSAGHSLEPDDRAVRRHGRVEERRIHLLRYVSPSEPSTMAVKRVFSGTGDPPASTWNFGRVRRSLNLDAVDRDRGTLPSSSTRPRALEWCRDWRSRRHIFR